VPYDCIKRRNIIFNARKTNGSDLKSRRAILFEFSGTSLHNRLKCSQRETKLIEMDVCVRVCLFISMNKLIFLSLNQVAETDAITFSSTSLAHSFARDEHDYRHLHFHIHQFHLVYLLFFCASHRICSRCIHNSPRKFLLASCCVVLIDIHLCSGSTLMERERRA
jgi:hypothetical protein